MAKRKPTSVAYAADESGNPITGATAVAELPTANAVVDDLRETARVITAAEMDQYRELVTRVADGSKFDDAEKASARALLRSVGRTFEDLANDAETLREIRRLVGIVEPEDERSKQLYARIQETKAAWEQAKQEVNAAYKKFHDARWALDSFAKSSARLRAFRAQFAQRTGGEA